MLWLKLRSQNAFDAKFGVPGMKNGLDAIDVLDRSAESVWIRMVYVVWLMQCWTAWSWLFAADAKAAVAAVVEPPWLKPKVVSHSCQVGRITAPFC
ncbi:hypothetical protein Nepgr_033639 [Nepenthes gracilis]|uniref:Uncharacterized protein n=1 Tax=Nepenthes gracilis TaxID=150966 RepID=A0AAD3TLJ3_NEPGR|nr:hypothetical protein Nepgr_033639 [Nepenthes gracilis]